MTELLRGKPVADSIKEDITRLIRKAGVQPELKIIRVGEKEDDISYEKSLIAAGDKIGITVNSIAFPKNVSISEFKKAVLAANEDPKVSGILPLRPLPPELAGLLSSAHSLISPKKDVDGVSVAAHFSPCTAEAVMRLLEYYEIPIEGKRALVIGRSDVIGKPIARLLLAKHATITIAHSKTRDLPALAREADILVACAGVTTRDADGQVRGGIGKECLSEKQVVVDVGIHVSEQGTIFGDVQKEAAEGFVSALAPVPGGVGSITTAVLLEHVALAAAN